VLPHSEEVAEAAAVLSEHARPRVPWQRLGVVLFNHGFSLREDTLRTCATFLGAGVQDLMERAWIEASLAPESQGSDSDRLEDLAFLAAECFIRRRNGRPVWLSYERLTRRALPTAPEAEIDLIAKFSLAMRIADAVGAGPLTAEQLHSARYFSDRARSEAPRQPLMSERQACAETLTAREAYTYRDLVLVQMGDDLDGHQALLDLVVWTVTSDRLATEFERQQPPRADRPLATTDLDEVEEMVAKALVDR
jgi:hypothetical protein